MDSQDQQDSFEEGSESKLSKDDILRSKFFERNFEKIIKILKEPKKPSSRDFVIIGLLLIILAVLIFKPMGGGETGRLTSNQSDENSKKLDEMSRKLDRIEKQILVATGAEEISKENIDKITSTQTPEEEPEETPTQDKEQLAVTKPLKASKMNPSREEPGTSPKSYKVKSGDTLSVICAKYYKSNNPDIIRALGIYNNLKGPDFDLFPGNTIKVPSKEELDAYMKDLKAKAKEKKKKAAEKKKK